MYKRARQGWFKHLDFILLDVICAQLGFILAYGWRFGFQHWVYEEELYRNLAVWLALFDVTVAVIFNTMRDVLKRRWTVEVRQTLIQSMLVFGFLVIYLFSVKDSDKYSRLVLWITLIIYIVLSFIARMIWKQVLRRRKRNEQKRSLLLIVDEGYVQQTVKRFHAHPLEGIAISGLVLANRDATGEMIEDIPVVADLSNAPKYICREWIDEVYISTATPPVELIERCNEMGVTVHRELHTAGNDQQFVEKIADKYVLTNSMHVATSGQVLAKRILDILGGLVGSFITLFLIIFIGPIIKRESPGPVLFKQERIGQNGKHFKMYKLRSMYMDAEKRKKELMKDNRVSDGMMFKLDFDPRIIGNEILPDGTHKTGIGEFIRNTSLDEFPQFFNVLMGQMSLVGTRPPTLDEWEKYEYHHRARLSVKPGLTGMWQTSGRSNITDFEEVVKLDTEYINSWSLGLDIRILLKTVKAVFTKEGAM